jgi:hypothetical protein
MTFKLEFRGTLPFFTAREVNDVGETLRLDELVAASRIDENLEPAVQRTQTSCLRLLPPGTIQTICELDALGTLKWPRF